MACKFGVFGFFFLKGMTFTWKVTAMYWFSSLDKNPTIGGETI